MDRRSDTTESTTSTRRERSVRYPGATLGEAIEFCGQIDAKGLDGLPAARIAPALGFRNLRTNTFSGRLSAARQFGLLRLLGGGEGYELTDLARALIRPADPATVPALMLQALREPPLYASLAARFGGKRLPEAATLADLLQHTEEITPSAKAVAAATFLESARQAGAIDAGNIFHPDGVPPARTPNGAPPEGTTTETAPRGPRRRKRTADGKEPVRIDLTLWGPDAGKMIRLRAPATITPESYERFLSAFRLLVRIEAPPPEGGGED